LDNCFGARTIIMARPSIFGFCSTDAISSVSLIILSSKSLPSWVINKLFDMIDLGLQIVFAGLWSYLYFLELKRSLFLFCFLSLLGQFIFIPTIIHYLADRRNSVGRNFNQVKTKIICNSKCLVSGDNADLIAFRVNYSDLFCPYISIDIYSIGSVWSVFMFR